MTEAVIVSTAGTPIGKADRGACNLTRSADMGGYASWLYSFDHMLSGCAGPTKGTRQLSSWVLNQRGKSRPHGGDMR